MLPQARARSHSALDRGFRQRLGCLPLRGIVSQSQQYRTLCATNQINIINRNIHQIIWREQTGAIQRPAGRQLSTLVRTRRRAAFCCLRTRRSFQTTRTTQVSVTSTIRKLSVGAHGLSHREHIKGLRDACASTRACTHTSTPTSMHTHNRPQPACTHSGCMHVRAHTRRTQT